MRIVSWWRCLFYTYWSQSCTSSSTRGFKSIITNYFKMVSVHFFRKIKCVILVEVTQQQAIMAAPFLVKHGMTILLVWSRILYTYQNIPFRSLPWSTHVQKIHIQATFAFRFLHVCHHPSATWLSAYCFCKQFDLERFSTKGVIPRYPIGCTPKLSRCPLPLLWWNRFYQHMLIILQIISPVYETDFRCLNKSFT